MGLRKILRKSMRRMPIESTTEAAFPPLPSPDGYNGSNRKRLDLLLSSKSTLTCAELNLRVLRRHYPETSSILSIAPPPSYTRSPPRSNRGRRQALRARFLSAVCFPILHPRAPNASPL